MERVEQPEFSKGKEGRREEKARLHRGTRETIGSPNTMMTPPTTTLMILQWRKMVPFVICRTRFPFCIAQNTKWTDSENNKQGFALDVIFQNETVCNFCLKKNVLLFFREA